MEAINAYFDTYYVPNNMAVIMVGDIDFDKTIEKVNNAFGSYVKKEVTHPTFPELEPINAPVKKEVLGPTSESVYVAFRSKGKGSKQELMLTLVDNMLANSQAGLIDLNLNQKQIVQNASSKGEFEDWLLNAVVNDLRLSQIRQYENNSSTAYAYLDAFISRQNWLSRLEMLDQMKKITKKDVIDFGLILWKLQN